MSDQQVRSIPVCDTCTTKPWVEQWETAGLVLVCECGEWQSIKTNSTLPREWSE
jgi:hypothetical protein